MGNRHFKVNKRHITIESVYLFIQLMYNKIHHLAKWSIFIRCLMYIMACTTPFPQDPRRPLHMLYMFIATYHCPKGILGLGAGGGKASKNKLKNTNFIFPMTKVTVLSVFRTNAQEEYRYVLEMKNASILNI